MLAACAALVVFITCLHQAIRALSLYDDLYLARAPLRRCAVRDVHTHGATARRYCFA